MCSRSPRIFMNENAGSRTHFSGGWPLGKNMHLILIKMPLIWGCTVSEKSPSGMGHPQKIPKRFSASIIPNPHPRDWGSFRDFYWGFLGIPNPRPQPRGSFVLVQNKKSSFPKITSRRHLLHRIYKYIVLHITLIYFHNCMIIICYYQDFLFFWKPKTWISRFQVISRISG